MRQNVIKAAAEAATARQRACMCMCGAKGTLSNGLTTRTLCEVEVQASDLLDDVTRATLHGFCSALTSRQPRWGYIPACVNCDAVPQAAVNWP